VPAPVLYTGANQINAIVPFNLALTAPATVEVRRGQTAATLSVPVAPAAPAIFTLSASGTGPGAILNQDFTPNSSFSPAARDSVIMIYGTGFGMLDPAPADGQIAAGPALQVLPVSVSIGAIPAEVSYAGASPGLISGLTQINVRVPKTLPPDPVTPLSIRVGTASIPSPISFSRPPTQLTITETSVARKDRNVYLVAMWFFPVAEKVDVAVAIGPSWVSVRKLWTSNSSRTE